MQAEIKLQEIFTKHSTVVSVVINADKNNRLNKFGLVCMEKAEESQKAIAIFNVKELCGRKISVSQARPCLDRIARVGFPRSY